MGVLINRVKLRNFKSIAGCDVSLDDLTVLVGVNGSGKSNFLDAFSFIADACNTTLDGALRSRGGLSAVRRKSSGHPNNFGVAFHMALAEGRNAFFAFELSAKNDQRFSVKREVAHISHPDLAQSADYEVREGRIVKLSNLGVRPDIRQDRLFLTSIAGLKPFDMLFDALSGLTVYDINPEEFRLPQTHEAADRLKPSGQNVASVLRHVSETSPATHARICEYVHRIIRGVDTISVKSQGPTETIQFSQRIQGAASPWRFDALNMSSGTLRSLGVLVALFHQSEATGKAVPFIGIEEPEGTIHPGAAAVLMDAIIETSMTSQVLLTTHSPQLLDHPRINDNNLLVVTSEGNETTVGPADAVSRNAMQEKLFTAGELLNASQLETDKNSARAITQKDLFEQSQ